MAKISKRKIEPENVKEVAIIEQPKKELVLEGDPKAQLEFAMKAANALMMAVAHKPKKVMIRGEQYLEYGDWQTLARFFGATASIAWTKKLTDVAGYEARAEVLHNGQVISSAEAMCTREEANWRSRDEFMLRSMAQTRAAAKALRNAYGWVAELAGMKSTPAEEMGYDTSPVPANAVPTVTMDDPEVPEDETKQKQTIIHLLRMLNPKDDMKDKKVVEQLVADYTELALVPANYKSICEALKEEVEKK